MKTPVDPCHRLPRCRAAGHLWPNGIGENGSRQFDSATENSVSAQAVGNPVVSVISGR